jgi:hypothetical protein
VNLKQHLAQKQPARAMDEIAKKCHAIF